MAEPLEPAPAARERPLPLIAAVLAEIAAAAALVRAEGAFFQEHHLARSIQTAGGINVLGIVEARFFLAHVIAGLPAALLLTDAATRLLGGRDAPWSARVISRPRLTALLFAIAAGVFTAVIASAVLGHAPLTDDESIYLAQARALLDGSFSAPAPGSYAAFPYGFMIAVQPGRWAGVYPPGQPLLMAVGLFVAHTPYLLQPFLAAGTVYVAARLAADLWDAETSVVTAALLGTSPFLLFNAATLLNALPATFFCLVAVKATYAALEEGRRRDHAVAGAALGFAFLCRPYDAVVVGLPLLVVLLRSAFRRVTPARPARGTAGLAWCVAAALPSLLLYLVANRATTGDAFLPAYSRWLDLHYPGAKTIGFGPTVFGGWHTVQLMFSKALVVLVRLSTWMFGWPLSFWPLLALILGAGRDRRSRLLLAVLGVHFLAYCLYTANAVQDTGSVYHLVEAPFIALLSARAIVALGRALRVFGERPSLWPGRFALACSLIGLFTFWPDEVGWVRRTSEIIRAPLAAAEQGTHGQPSLVFWREMYPPGHGPGSQLSWVLHPPLPGPRLDDRVLWAKDLGPGNLETLARFSQRTPYRLVWEKSGPRVIPYDAAEAQPAQAAVPGP